MASAEQQRGRIDMLPVTGGTGPATDDDEYRTHLPTRAPQTAGDPTTDENLDVDPRAAGTDAGTKRRRLAQLIDDTAPEDPTGQQQGSINMLQVEGASDAKRRRVQQLLVAGGQDKALDVATSAEGGAEFLESAGAYKSKIDMSAGGGQLQNDPPAKNNFRQKKKPTVHHTSRRTGDYRATHKGGRGKQLDSASWHTTTTQPKTRDPQ